MASRLWKFLTTDIREFISLDTVDGAKDATEAVLGLANVLAQEGPNTQQLAPLVSQLDSLLDVLNSPLGKVVEAGLPFVSIGTGLLKFYLEKTKKEPTLAQTVALISQAAYLESFKEFSQQHPKIQQWLTVTSRKQQAKAITPEVKALGKLELSDRDARLATLHFHQSTLAEAFNGALEARLIQLGAKPDAANKIADLVGRGTNSHIRDAIADAGNSVKRITEWYRTGGDEVFEKYLSIDTYLEEWIAPRPYEKVFAEDFSFKDIYVPLKAQPLTAAGKIDLEKDPVFLESWAKQMLNNPAQKDAVMFVQGGPGRGKSVFCRMFADWVRRHEHPRWTPILIRLRDVSVLSKDFEETLSKAVDRDFAKTDAGWLTDRNVNFLFLLDGFDELLMEGRTSGGLDNFLEQVGRFQEQCARNSEKQHRVLITGRTLALQSIESRMPSNLARIDIIPMDDRLQAQWLTQWQEILSEDELNLKEILGNDQLPERLQELSREPLLLYLLAAMYRDKELKLEMFKAGEDSQSKVLIYERTLDWVLTKQRAKGYRKEPQSLEKITAQDLNPDITELAPESLRRVLQEAGLCVVQSGMEFAHIQVIEDRLSQDNTAKDFLTVAQKKLETDDTPLRNALAAFYLQEGRQGEGAIEFVHKSFGEFLCAERIAKSFIDWCQPGRNRQYDIPNPEFYWEIYDLLGVNALTPEIVEYLIALLFTKDEFDGHKLLKRLQDFYNQWRDGFFIDSDPPTLPQKKMKEINNIQNIPKKGQRQIDAVAGLNVLIMLLKLSKSLQMDEFLMDLHLYYDIHKVIGYSRCLGSTGFAGVLGAFNNLVNITIRPDENNTAFFINGSIANSKFVDLYFGQINRLEVLDNPWAYNLTVNHPNSDEPFTLTPFALTLYNTPSNNDLQMVLQQLKQKVSETTEIIPSDKLAIEKCVNKIQEELEAPNSDTEYINALLSRLKKKVGGISALSELIMQMAELIEKA